jgi:HlyD family secretion protein
VNRILGRWLGIALAVVVVGGGGLLLVRRLRAGSAEAAPQYFLVPASVGPVTVSVSGTGSIVPTETATVLPSVGGVVASVPVAVGQHVRQGQTLFRLADTADLAGQVTADAASLANAENSLENLLHPVIDPRSVQAAELKVQQSQVALRQAELSLSQAESQGAQATAVASPVDGLLQAVDVQPGQQVNQGATLAVVQPMAPVEVTVPVPSFELPFLPTGARAVVEVAGVPGDPIPGTVIAAAGSAGAGSGATAGSTGSTPAATGTGGGGGGASSAGSCANASAASGDVVVRLAAAPRSAVPGASANVVFTPVGSAPACDAWSAAGTITYPAAVTLTASQAGTVTGVLGTVGQRVAVGKTLVTLSSPQEQASLQQDELAVQNARLALQQAEISLQQTAHPEPPTSAAVAAAELQVSALKDTLAQAQRSLAELDVQSPMNGIVTAVNIYPGESVGASTAAVSLESAGPLQAQASIAETDIGQVHVGAPAQVTVQAYPGKTYNGRVVQVSPAATSTGGVATFEVTVALNSSRGLLAGMSDTVNIQVAEAAQAVRVPAQAVTVIPGSSNGIVRVMENGKPVAKPVKVGLVGASFTQILSGLQPGVPVVAGQASAATTSPFAGRGGFGGFGGFGGGGFARGGAAFFGGGFGRG